MISLWREELQQLAGIESVAGNAVTFYYQPQTPQDKSHRKETIVVKDLVRDALRNLERHGHHSAARDDLKRVLRVAEKLRGNHSRAKAIFACAERGFWQEFDLPPGLEKTQLHVNSRFHLKPIASAVLSVPHACIALLDREHARFYDLYMDQISERGRFDNKLSPHGRGDGFMGFDAGHRQRHVENEAMRHFKQVAERLQEFHAADHLETLLIGCRPETWSALQPHLHADVRQALVARLDLGPGAMPERVRIAALRAIEIHQDEIRAAHMKEVLGEAQRNGRGSLGLRHVITSLERGEVQHLLIGKDFAAAAVECTHCGHMDTRRVDHCAVCTKDTREVEDISSPLIGYALRHGVEISYVAGDDEFTRAGNIAALLRFRSDQNTVSQKAG